MFLTSTTCDRSLSSDGGYDLDYSFEDTSNVEKYPIGIAACDFERVLVCYRGMPSLFTGARYYSLLGAFGTIFCAKGGREDQNIAWKTHAHQAAFYWPHFLLFSYSQIEVRNICTGTFIQMIDGIGTDIRCISSCPAWLSDAEEKTGIICVGKDVPGLEDLASLSSGSGIKTFEISQLLPAGTL